MNLPLLVWAVQQGADAGLMDVVRAQVATRLSTIFALTAQSTTSTSSTPTTGEGAGGDTYQGLSPESSWARGQAWAITALAILAAMTADRNYQATSERVADYFLSKLPDDGVPPWDFTAPGSDVPKDFSAGAIASYGLIKLYGITQDRRHLQTATRF